MTHLTLDQTIVRSAQLITREVDGDVVMLSIERGKYYGTEIVGSRIWTLIESPIQIREVCQALLEEFDIDEPTCQQDVLEFLGQLQDEQLIDVV